eukprot:UN02195
MICTPLRKCCLNCGKNTKEFFDMPMSVYVLVSFVLSTIALNWASTDLGSQKNCSSTYLYLLMGMAVLNVVFAIYFQCKLWGKIMEQEEKFEIDEEDAKGSYAAAGKGMLQNVAGHAKAAAGGAVDLEAPGPAPSSTSYKQRIPAGDTT